MKQKRYIAWMLVVVSMVMLVASVLPHHHHQHLLCLDNDVETCACTCEDHHAPDADHHEGCEGHCITHFVSVTPDTMQDYVSPDYTFCQLIYTLADVMSVSLPVLDLKANPSYFYLEKLHSTCLGHVRGLRAPPVA